MYIGDEKSKPYEKSVRIFAPTDKDRPPIYCPSQTLYGTRSEDDSAQFMIYIAINFCYLFVSKNGFLNIERVYI